MAWLMAESLFTRILDRFICLGIYKQTSDLIHTRTGPLSVRGACQPPHSRMAWPLSVRGACQPPHSNYTDIRVLITHVELISPNRGVRQPPSVPHNCVARDPPCASTLVTCTKYILFLWVHHVCHICMYCVSMPTARPERPTARPERSTARPQRSTASPEGG